MFFTYVLESLRDHRRYIGSTSNLYVRLNMHNTGRVKSTMHRKPLKLIYFESFKTMNEARWRERSFKRSHDLLRRAMLKIKNEGVVAESEAAGPEGLWPGGR